MILLSVGLSDIIYDGSRKNREESELKRVASHRIEEGERDEEGVEVGDSDSREYNHFFIYSKCICRRWNMGQYE